MAQYLRHCATSRKVAGSIPECFIGILHWQSEYNEHFLSGEGGRYAEKLTTFVCRLSRNLGLLKYLDTSGPVIVLHRDSFTFPKSSTYNARHRSENIKIAVHIYKVYLSCVYNRPTRCTNSYNGSLFIIKCSTCFGIFSPSSRATFWSCISHLV